MPGLIGIDNITDIEARVIVSEVLGLANRKYNLRKLTRVITMDQLIGDVPVATKLVGSTKVPEFVEARLSSQSYTKLSFNLWKNVVHVAISREAQRRARYDVLQMHVQDAARELAKMENDQIATALETTTNTLAGSDWGLSNDPASDIMAAQAQIESLELGFNANYIAMHPLVYADLVTNELVKKYMSLDSVARTGNLPEFCGLPIIRDPALTNTIALVVSTEAPAVVLGDGPSMVEKYTGGPAFYDGYAIAKFLEPKIVQSSVIVKITGVHA
jgi:hypothetical protein